MTESTGKLIPFEREYVEACIRPRIERLKYAGLAHGSEELRHLFNREYRTSIAPRRWRKWLNMLNSPTPPEDRPDAGEDA